MSSRPVPEIQIPVRPGDPKYRTHIARGHPELANTMPPRRTIRDEDWERLRPTTRKLYLEDDRSLKDVLLILGTCHSFYPSKAQLEWKLKQWHFTKNMGVMDWKYIGSEIHRRKCRGKGSKVYLSGIPLRTKAIERGISRYCYETAIEKATCHVPEPPMPEDQPLLVCTPVPEETNGPFGLDNLPWFISRRLIDGLALKMPHNLSIDCLASHASSEVFAGSILFPNVTLQGYTTQLRQTFAALRLVMPEECEGGHVARAQGLLQKSGPQIINAESLFCLVFLLSNDLLSWEHDIDARERQTATARMLLRLLRESASNVLAKGQYLRLPLSLQSSLDGLFREAIRATDLGGVEVLLEAGVDANTSFLVSLGGYAPQSGTALQHAAASNHPELIRVLIGYGADTHQIGINTINKAWLWRKAGNGSPEETMKILLSYYHFRSEDETHAVRLLHQMSYTATTPFTEAVINTFRFSFSEGSPAAKAQLLITSIRTHSRFIDELVADSGSYVNSCGYYPETPMTAAVFQGDIQLCKKLLHLGADLEPDNGAATPLQWAASFSDVRTVKLLLDWGADVNFCHPRATLLRLNFEDANSMRFSCPETIDLKPEEWHQGLVGSLGMTALHAALLGGEAAIAICLLTAGAQLVGGELVMAIWSRQFEIIESLLEKGASFQDECTIFGTDTVLEAAILSENTDLVYRVIAADSQLVTGQALCVSVFLAKATNDCTILQYLLTYTSQLQASEDTWIGTVMCLAAHLQCIEIPEIMLRSGLRPKTSWPFHLYMTSIYDHLGKSECSIPVSSMNRSYLSWQRSLSQYCSRSWEDQLDPRRPMVDIAVSLGHWDYLKILLDNGYQPGATSSLGVRYSRDIAIDTLRLLHSLGIKMTEHILTHVIHVSQDREIIDWLLSVGVDINEMSENRGSIEGMIHGSWISFTPLQMAAFEGDIELIQQLIDYGADVNQPPYRNGGTSLQNAAQQGFFGIVQRLLELGADPNAPGCEPPYDRTALEAAAEHGRLDVVQLLLNSGVEISGCGRRQYVRSIVLADAGGHHAIIELLKSHAGWTKTDENLVSGMKKELTACCSWARLNVPRYVRGYYGDESDWEDSVDSETSEEDRPSEGDDLLPEDYVLDIEQASNGNDRLEKEEVLVEGCTSETPTMSGETISFEDQPAKDLDSPSKTVLSTSSPISNFPDAYETVLEEVALEFLPSSMSYQIREELEGDGCLENLGDDLWAEEYSRFIAELV